MKRSLPFISLILLAGCATQHETVTVEKKKGVTIIHHRSLVGSGARDRIESVSANGSITTATIQVYDIGRMPDGQGGVQEAHKYYRVVESTHPNLSLPKHVSSGPRTVYTPPNYSPLPADQRISDAVTEAREAKKKLEDATNQVKERLATDNALQGELQDAKDQNQKLVDQIQSSMNTPKKKVTPTDAEQAAETSTSDLQKWGQSQSQQ